MQSLGKKKGFCNCSMEAWEENEIGEWEVELGVQGPKQGGLIVWDW